MKRTWNRGTRDERRSTQHTVVNVKIMISVSPSCSIPYYTIAMTKPHKAGFYEVARVQKNQVGRGYVNSLIEALTQDPVLETISPCAKKEMCK